MMNNKLVLVAGFAGTGKTYIGAELAKRLPSSVFLDKDTLTRPFTEKVLTLLTDSTCSSVPFTTGPHDRESAGYLQLVRPLEYSCLMNQARENLALGKSVIASAPYIAEVTDADWIINLRREIQHDNATLKIILVQADSETSKTRIMKRNAARDSWKLTHWDRYRETIKEGIVVPTEHFTLDNSISSAASISQRIQEAKDYILQDMTET